MSKPTELAREAATLNDVEWFDFLDEIDEVARRRRQNQEPEPDGTNRDAVAAYIARLHFIGDNKVREIWYLPTGSPADEIRLIEINERFAIGLEFEPQDFNDSFGGHPYRMRVVDATSDQLEQARRDLSRLPPGWTLDGATPWRRGT